MPLTLAWPMCSLERRPGSESCVKIKRAAKADIALMVSHALAKGPADNEKGPFVFPIRTVSKEGLARRRDWHDTTCGGVGDFQRSRRARRYCHDPKALGRSGWAQ